MKPKRTVFCPDCGRCKIVFESEKKAWNFIRYNAQEIYEISGKAPCRVYWCPSCAGYHVTSKRTSFKIKTRTEKLISAYNRISEFKREEQYKTKQICDLVSDTLFQVETNLSKLNSKYDEEIRQEIDTLLNSIEIYGGSPNRRKKILSQLKEIDERYKKIDYNFKT